MLSLLKESKLAYEVAMLSVWPQPKSRNWLTDITNVCGNLTPLDATPIMKPLNQ